MISRIFLTITLAVALANAEDKWTPSPLCPYPSEELTRFPYEGDCTKYWECFEGARYPMSCPSGLEYNEDYHRCDAPEIANCNKDETFIYPTFAHSEDPSHPTDPSSAPWFPDPLCPYPSEEIIYYDYPEDCTKYYECFEGNKYLMTCPNGLYWNEPARVCDFEENVVCHEEPHPTTSIVTQKTTTGTNKPPSTAAPSTSCTDKPDGLLLADPTDCNKFFECVGGIAIEESCPSNLLFNEIAQSCDFPINVSCKV